MPVKPQLQLTELTAVDAVKAMSAGELTCEAYATALLKRCSEAASLNAFISLEPHRVLEAARDCDKQRASGNTGRLFGLPIPVKDSVNTRSLPTTAGTPALRHFRPTEDAPIVRTLVDAGAILLGKTNLHELSYGWTSNNLAFGAVRNPYDATRIPGGSSGGTAAAIASGMAPLGVAEDTEGSIRVPAALCGIVGFRPTTRRYSTAGAVPISPLFDQVGPHARTVGDIALFDSVATGDWSPLQRQTLAGLRLGVGRSYWYTDLHPDVERVSNEVLRRLRAAGAHLVETDIPDLARLVALTTNQVQNHDVRFALAEYLKRYGAGVTFDELVARASADIKRDFALGVLAGGRDFVTEEAYRQATLVHLPAIRKAYRDHFARTGVAAMVFPATLIAAPRIGDEGEQSVGSKSVAFETAIARNIAPGSTAGIPGLVLPAGMTPSGLPVAIELDGPAGSDRALLSIGAAVAELLDPLPRPRLA